MNTRQEIPVSKPQENGENPYKLLDFYEEEDAGVFRGRTEETDSLFQLVKFNFLTVTFGKSGIGKTSLLNAGLFPRLRKEGFLPIRVKLSYSRKEEDAASLVQQIPRTILEEIDKKNENTKKSLIEVKTQKQDEETGALAESETLWEYFHRAKFFKSADNCDEKEKMTPVIVFDQFEEFFTLGKDYNEKEKNDLIDELFWLIEEQFPAPLKKRILKERRAKADKKERKITFSFTRPEMRVVICLREDYLPHLTELKSRIPSINRKEFRVTHLNGNQAREVIELGFDEKSAPVILRCFYPEGIRDNQADTVAPEKLEVEPVFLSLLCHQLFEKQPLEFITKQDHEKIIEDFYESVVTGYPDEVKIFIEKELLNERGFRRLFYLAPDEPLREYIDRLVDRRILRISHYEKREHVEIIHDELAHIVKEQRERRFKGIREQEEKEHLRKRFYRIVIAGISFIAVIVIIFSTVVITKTKEAHEKQQESRINRLIAQAVVEFPKDNTKAIRIVEEAIKESEDNSVVELFKILNEIGYSSYHRPFYIAITPLNHSDVIYSAMFSSDNQRILTAHEDGTAYIQDLEGNIQLKLKGHKKRIMSAVFSQDENLILTASWDKTARLWSREGKLLKELKHDGPLTCASFSPDGKQILTASLDNTARLWNLQGRQMQEFKHQGRVISVSFSRDGQKILTASWDKTAKLWNREGRLLANLSKHNNTLSSAVFSPDGHYILTGSLDRTALLWNDQGEVLATFEHDSAIVSALFSPDEKIILTAALDGTVKLWDRESKELKTSIKHEGIMSTVLFSPDGNIILTASEKGAIKLWDLEGIQRAHFGKQTKKIYASAFNSDGHYLFTSSQGELSILWDLQPNIMVDLKHNDQVYDAIFSPDGEYILTVSGDGIARLWDNKGKLLVRFRHEIRDERIIAAFFTLTKDLILTASSYGTIKLWDRQGECTKTFSVNVIPLNRVVFSKDGSKILPLSNYTVVNLWNLQGEIIKKFHHDEIICEATFSSNGEQLLTVSCGDNKKPNYKGDEVTLWNLHHGNDNNPITSFNQENIVSVVFSPNNSLILTASQKGEAIVRNLSGKILHRLNLAIENKELLSTSFSPDGKYILTILGDGLAILWDLKGVYQTEFKHDQVIYTAGFSWDGKQVLTASMDMTAKLWDLRGNLLSTFTHEGEVFSAAFSPDGNQVVTASRDATAKVRLTPSAILQWLENSKISRLTEDDKKKLKISPYDN